MERNSLIYHARRKLQIIVYHILPHELLSKIYFKIYLHEDVDLDNPKTLNEKLQWLKLRYNAKNPTIIRCTDKYAVRSYVSEHGYSHILTDLLGVWEQPKEINWEELPEQFILKCTHGCAYNIACKDKTYFDKNKAIKQLNIWMKENFAAFNVELHYEKIKPRRVICEGYLGDVVTDYKFFCFNGEPKFFYVSSDLIHDRQAKIGFFDMNGEKLPIIRNDYEDIGNINMPNCFDEMVKAARVLSEDFPFCRVDFFLVGNYYRFAELTFSPAAAMMPINPIKYDYEWGAYLSLPIHGI